MSLIVDIALLLLIVLTVYNGYRKGFIHEIMNLVTFFASYAAARYFTPFLGEHFKNTIVIKRVSESVTYSLNSLFGNKLTGFADLFNEMPKAFTDLISQYQTDQNSLVTFYESDVLPNVSTSGVSDAISRYIADPVATVLSNVLAFLTVFCVTLIVFKIITFILDTIFKIPVLKFLNRMCGAVLGLFYGLLFVILLTMLMRAALPLLTALFPDFNQSIISESVLFKYLTNFPLLNKLDVNIALN
jgi:uncharacterized membrane protein required for colicin V production